MGVTSVLNGNSKPTYNLRGLPTLCPVGVTNLADGGHKGHANIAGPKDQGDPVHDERERHLTY